MAATTTSVFKMAATTISVFKMAATIPHLLLLVTMSSAVPRVNGEDFPLIQWSEGCDEYTTTVGRYPHILDISHHYSTTLSQCRALCTASTDCGGVRWDTTAGLTKCRIFNINDHIVTDHLAPNWYYTHSTLTWSSKNCGYDVGATNTSCDNYSHLHEGQYIYHNRWWIARTSHITSLTAAQCHTWCTLYTGCRSVAYQLSTSGSWGFCHLYSTTIPHLLQTGQGGDVGTYTGSTSIYTTFDRYCGPHTPYIPGEVTACDAAPCLNGGTCEVDDTDPQGYTCACDQGWMGHDCDQQEPDCGQMGEEGSCEFYQCLEDEMNCGQDGYPLGYGKKYCDRFTHVTYDEFDTAGQAMISCTRQCLTTLLLPWYTGATTGSCDDLNSAAFPSHVQCYVGCGFCDVLTPGNVGAFWSTFHVNDFFSTLAIQQVLSIMTSCIAGI